MACSHRRQESFVNKPYKCSSCTIPSVRRWFTTIPVVFTRLERLHFTCIEIRERCFPMIPRALFRSTTLRLKLSSSAVVIASVSHWLTALIVSMLLVEECCYPTLSNYLALPWTLHHLHLIRMCWMLHAPVIFVHSNRLSPIYHATWLSVLGTI